MTNNLNKLQGKKICFISANSYPLLSGKPTTRIIGPDVYTTILAKAMRDRNYQISIITYWDEVPPIENLNGMKIFKIKVDYQGIYKIFNKFLKLVSLWEYIVKADADYYFHAGGMDGASVLLCKIMRKKYIYSIGSDAQLNRQLISVNNNDFSKSKLNLGTFGCAVDILLVNTIIVQSEYQKRLLKEKFNKKGTIIKMPFPISEKIDFERTPHPTIIWVGSLAKVKQPELFVQLAERIPEANFVMIGGNYDESSDIPNYIIEKGVTLPNFRYLGVVPFNQIDIYFKKATILANTSLFEGFPNAFIQSWMYCNPVVSLNADPDEIICNFKLGFHSKSVDKMVIDIKELLRNPALCEQIGNNGRQYVENNHDINTIVYEYIDIFSN